MKQYHPDVNGSPDAGAVMTEINNAHQAALRYVSSNIVDQYTALKQQNAPTAQTEQKAVQLVNDITADSGAEPSAGAMTVSPNPAKTVAARGFETAEVPGPLNTGKGRFVLNLLTDPQIRAAIDNAWKTGYSNGEPLSLPDVASCLTKIIRGNGGEMPGEEGYEPDILIGRSLGAKAKNYDIFTPDGEILNLTEGSRIRNVEVIAGQGRNRQIDMVDSLVDKYGGDRAKWKKCKGLGYVDVDGESYLVELHWYEEPSIGRVEFKIKRQPGGAWFINED